VRPINERHVVGSKQGNGVIKIFNFQRGGRAHGGCAGRLPEIGYGKRAGADVVLDPLAFRKHAVHCRLEAEQTLVEVAGTLLVRDWIGDEGDFADFDHCQLR
jgi:hypothetical protein